MPKRMISRRQCVFVIVVLPLLIIPALIIINHADGQIDEVFIPPKRTKQTTRSSSRSLIEPYKVAAGHSKQKPKVKPAKCFDYIWTGTCKDTCHTFNVNNKQRQRKQTVLKCDNSRPQIKTIYTSKYRLVSKTNMADSCLQKSIKKFCHDEKQVPNIVHFVWFGKNEFKFIHFLSFLSVYKIQNPCLILLHADKLPVGKLWNYFLQICPKVVQVKWRQPKRVFSKKLVFVEHKADIVKLEALLELGGIYVDTDQIILKSLDKFRNEPCTIGLDYSTQATNSLILAKPKSPFIKLWYESYKSFSKMDGNKHSQVIPYKLSKRHPEMVNVVGSVFSGQNANQLAGIYSKNMDWSVLYGLHMHYRLQARFFSGAVTMDNIRGMNTTAGAIARWIMYQNTDLCTAV